MNVALVAIDANTGLSADSIAPQSIIAGLIQSRTSRVPKGLRLLERRFNFLFGLDPTHDAVPDTA